MDDLSRAVVNDTINSGELAASRAMVMETDAVDRRTTVMLMRVRSVIKDTKHPDRELVGEEMIFIGYHGKIDNHDFLSQEECKELFFDARASGNLDMVTQSNHFNNLTRWCQDRNELKAHTDDIALERASRLVSAFSQYRSYLAADEYQVVKPVLPMDVIAAFVFIPKRKI